MSKLVIVESPTKARTIRGFLPEGYHVEASMGHIRDLPSSAAEIPEKYKKEAWARLGVDVEHDFDPLYVVPKGKEAVVSKLRKLLKTADELILATDEDREGESIGWHLKEVLKPKVDVRRMVFHEITRDAIRAALDEMREIDDELVRAQETRRILDRLVGYGVSPLLWKKIAPKLSAGRVQSVAVRLLVLRERDRRSFRSGSYWDLTAQLSKRPDRPAHHFEALLYAVGDQRVASSRDFDETTGAVAAGRNVLLLNEEEAGRLRDRLARGAWRVVEVEEKEQSRTPGPPFTTSTLQQEANRKLGWGAKQTMRVAQHLYENGLITYMRTDSVNLSQQAIGAARRRIGELYGESFLSERPRQYSGKTKNAQEAHEAIRPAGDRMQTVDELHLHGEDGVLYDLIWKRTIATQMAAARLRLTTATIGVEDALFRASGRTVLFAGFMRAYVEGSDDPDAALDSRDAPLPPLSVDEIVDLLELGAAGHETKPPARYTEATLVKALESEGIGRPSTYATIIDTILLRGYAFRQRKELVPTFTAFAVTQLLEAHFSDLVDLGFTAAMEQELDDIANGDTEWLAYLRDFYLGPNGLEAQIGRKESAIDPRVVGKVDLGDFPYEVRIGLYGPYMTRQQNGEALRVSLPPDLPPADLTPEKADELFLQRSDGPRTIGIDPESTKPVTLRTGRFGPYVQLGEDDESGKARRASLLKGMTPDEVDLNTSLALLSLPRILGEHPESGQLVKAGVGRYGPYVVHEGTYANLRATDDVLTIDLDRALEVLAEKGTGRRGQAPAPGREVGEHPDGGLITAGQGRYGPYVQHNKVYASIPKGTDPATVTVEQALPWLAAAAERKAAKGGARSSRSKRSATAESATGNGDGAKSGVASKGDAKASTAKGRAAKKGSAKKSTTRKSTATKSAAVKRSTTKAASTTKAPARKATATGAAPPKAVAES